MNKEQRERQLCSSDYNDSDEHGGYDTYLNEDENA